MEKEWKSCTGVLLRADLTGHGHSSPFCQNGWDGRALLGQPSKGHPCRILILFPYCSTISLAPHIKKLETYFALLYFWTFAQCVLHATLVLSKLKISDKTFILILWSNFLFKMALNLLCTPLFRQLFHVCESRLVVPMASFEKKKLLSGFNFFL